MPALAGRRHAYPASADNWSTVKALVTRTPDIPTLAAGRLRFRRATPVDPASLRGDWRIEVTGPSLVRDRWDRALRLAGASGLHGLRFDVGSGGHLLARPRRRAPQEGRRLRVVAEPSRIDDLPCVAVTFPDPDRLPWPWLRLELRRLDREGTWPVDDGWLIGLLVADLPGRIPVPVLLEREPDTEG